MDARAIFIDINNSFIDIYKWIIDINNYGRRYHEYWYL